MLILKLDEINDSQGTPSSSFFSLYSHTLKSHPFFGGTLRDGKMEVTASKALDTKISLC